MAMAAHDEVKRQVIRDGLAALRERLAGLEQTTHAAIQLSDDPMQNVSFELLKAYSEPSAYRLSNLSQAIDHLLKGTSDGT